MCKEAGAGETEFDRLAAPVEAKCAAPWLRRKRGSAGVEEIVVVDLEGGVERLATTAEIDGGVFYKDHDDYVARGAP